jgi:signal peptidase I
MEDTILKGDVFLGNKFLYGIRIPMTDMRLPAIRNPKPGDIVIFRSLEEPSKNLVKRCVAVGGQTVEIRDKALYVDGKRAPFPEAGKFEDRRILQGTRSLRDNYGPVTVPPEHFFMMGVNRVNSYDSRYWGPVPKKNILAKATILYFSWDKQVPLWDIAHKIRWGRIAHLL